MVIHGHYLDALGPFLRHYPDAVASVVNKLFELLTSLPITFQVHLSFKFSKYHGIVILCGVVRLRIHVSSTNRFHSDVAVVHVLYLLISFLNSLSKEPAMTHVRWPQAVVVGLRSHAATCSLVG